MARASKTKQILLHITVVVLVLEFVVQVFLYIFSNKPISAGWDMDVRLAGYSHLNTTLEIFILSILYLLTDVWLLVLPLHTIWTLQLPLQTRIGVTWVFLFGGVACAGAILKAVHIYSTLNSFDPLCESHFSIYLCRPFCITLPWCSSTCLYYSCHLGCEDLRISSPSVTKLSNMAFANWNRARHPLCGGGSDRSWLWSCQLFDASFKPYSNHWALHPLVPLLE